MAHHLTQHRGLSIDVVRDRVLQDYLASGAHARPKCLIQEGLPLGGSRKARAALASEQRSRQSLRERQDRHHPPNPNQPHVKVS